MLAEEATFEVTVQRCPRKRKSQVFFVQLSELSPLDCCSGQNRIASLGTMQLIEGKYRKLVLRGSLKPGTEGDQDRKCCTESREGPDSQVSFTVSQGVQGTSLSVPW